MSTSVLNYNSSLAQRDKWRVERLLHSRVFMPTICGNEICLCYYLEFTFCCDCYNLITLNNNKQMLETSHYSLHDHSHWFCVLHIVLLRCWPLDQSGQVNWVLRKFLHLAFSLRYWCISQGLCCFVFFLLDEWVLIFYFS